jgi:2-dehydro-3-deoxyglucarate aldolase
MNIPPDNLKDKLKSQKHTIGSWLTLGNTAVTEIMAQAGFDWLVVDMEHSAITLDIAQEMIRVIELNGIASMVRVGHNQPNLIKRVMDCGAQGVIVPMVNSREEAKQAVDSVKYSPLGSRGVGLARAQGYGQNFADYQQWNQNNSIVIVQVEHIEAVDNLEAILSVDGVDGFVVGPYDLSGSLGVPGQFDHPDVLDALERVKKISNQKNALAGFHIIQPDVDKLVTKHEEGYRFLAFSLDTIFLGNSCRYAVQEAKNRF